MTKDYKGQLLAKLRANTAAQYDMPQTAVQGVTYADPVAQFVETSEAVGSRVLVTQPGYSLDDIVRSAYPQARAIASNLSQLTIATANPDGVVSPQDLNGTDVGVVAGQVGVAENGCVWVPQTMREKAVCFISEYLVIVLPKSAIVSNMHQAYDRIEMTEYGFGSFISGPSKTADIEQALVMGAQAARGVTVVLTDD